MVDKDYLCTPTMLCAYSNIIKFKTGLPIKENPLKTDIGDNKTISKFWEVLLALEFDRKPRPSDQKLRDLMKRALKDVRDFPPVIIRMWTAFERDYGTIETLQECKEICQVSLVLIIHVIPGSTSISS